MAKIDDIITSIGNGYNDPSISFGYTMVEDKYMEQVKVRRKGPEAEQYKLCYLAVGEMGQPATVIFYGHKLSDCVKKALEWRGLPTKSKRGQRKEQPQS
jgi:hypothetical protein